MHYKFIPVTIAITLIQNLNITMHLSIYITKYLQNINSKIPTNTNLQPNFARLEMHLEHKP